MVTICSSVECLASSNRPIRSAARGGLTDRSEGLDGGDDRVNVIATEPLE